MNPYRKRQRRKLQRAVAHINGDYVTLTASAVDAVKAMVALAGSLRATGKVIAVSNPVRDNWVQQAFRTYNRAPQ